MRRSARLLTGGMYNIPSTRRIPLFKEIALKERKKKLLLSNHLLLKMNLYMLRSCECTEALEFIFFGSFSRFWFSAPALRSDWTWFMFVCIISFYQKSSFDRQGLTLKWFQSIHDRKTKVYTHSLGTIETWRSACFCPVPVAVIAYAAHLRMFHMIDCWGTANHILRKHYVQFEWRFPPS